MYLKSQKAKIKSTSLFETENAPQTLRIAHVSSSDQLLIVWARQQIVGAGTESYGANFVAVRPEDLYDSWSRDIIEHHRGVLVAGDEQTTVRIDAKRSDGRT